MEDKLLANRYQLIEQIDSGGTSYIYKALDVKNNRIVAIKMLKPEYSDDSQFVERFKKEVSASLRLKHANIIRSYDAGKDGDKYYIAMDFIDGRTLKHIISINEPLNIKFVVNIAKKICLALEYAHVKGFIHRDIKPQNIMIDKDGEPYIADFGIAKKVNGGEAQKEGVVGSVHYFSPEQAKGEDIDKRTDIYSLGIVIYEMLTGKVPYDGESSVEIALMHINNQIPDVTLENDQVPKSLEKIIKKATSKSKENRYKSAFAMYEDLMRCMDEPDGDYIKLAEEGDEPQSEKSKQVKSHKLIKIIVLSSVAIVAALTIIVVFFNAAFMDTNANIPVPNVVNKTEEEAVSEIKASNLVPEVTYNYNDEIASGVTLSQEPVPGEKVKENETIKIYVSLGPELPYMPDVTNISIEEAVSILESSGITNYEITYLVDSSVPDGYVVSQVPSENDPIASDETVILTVNSTEEGSISQMPGVVGSPLEEGVARLSESNFKNIYVYEVDSDEEGGIITTQPEENVETFTSSPCILSVSRYANIYEGSSQIVNIAVPKDNTDVKVAIKQNIGGAEVYFIIYADTVDSGVLNTQIEINVGLPDEDYIVEKQVAVLLNDQITEEFTVTLNGRE